MTAVIETIQVCELAAGLLSRAHAIIVAPNHADQKLLAINTRLKSIVTTLETLTEYAMPETEISLRQTGLVMHRAAVWSDEWRSVKRKKMNKLLKGRAFNKRFEQLKQDLDGAVQTLQLCVSAAVMGMVKHAKTSYKYDPPDNPTKSLIGEGRFGQVHRVWELGTKVWTRRAMKVIDIVKADKDGVSSHTLQSEAALLKEFDHPHIVKYIECFRQDDIFYIVMEHMDGFDLGRVVGETQEVVVIRTWTRQICEGLAYMHKRKILHRDIKPENILLDGQRTTVKLCDFGFSAKMRDGGGRDSAVGTLHYKSPQKDGMQDYGSADDMWAVGCVVAELLTRTRIQARCGERPLCKHAEGISAFINESTSADEVLGDLVKKLLQGIDTSRPSAKDVVATIVRDERGVRPPPPGPVDVETVIDDSHVGQHIRIFSADDIAAYRDLNDLPTPAPRDSPRRRGRQPGLTSLARQKLADPDLALTAKESIEVIVSFLSEVRTLSTELVQSFEGMDAKTLVLFVGNTDSGKSTLINYLLGYKFEFYVYQARKALRCVSDGPPPCETSAESESHTIWPKMCDVRSAQIILCDLPGFLDTRGSEVKISNAVAFRHIVAAAKDVKIVFVQSHADISAARGAPGKNALGMLRSMLVREGGQLSEYKSSILCAFTKVDVDLNLHDMCEAKGVEELLGKVDTETPVDVLNAFIVDPTEKHTHGASAQAVLDSLENRLVALDQETAARLTTPHFDSSEIALIADIARQTAEEIQARFDEDDAAGVLEEYWIFEALECLDHPQVTKSQARLRNAMTRRARQIQAEVYNAVRVEDPLHRLMVRRKMRLLEACEALDACFPEDECPMAAVTTETAAAVLEVEASMQKAINDKIERQSLHLADVLRQELGNVACDPNLMATETRQNLASQVHARKQLEDNRLVFHFVDHVGKLRWRTPTLASVCGDVCSLAVNIDKESELRQFKYCFGDHAPLMEIKAAWCRRLSETCTTFLDRVAEELAAWDILDELSRLESIAGGVIGHCSEERLRFFATQLHDTTVIGSLDAGVTTDGVFQTSVLARCIKVWKHTCHGKALTSLSQSCQTRLESFCARVQKDAKDILGRRLQTRAEEAGSNLHEVTSALSDLSEIDVNRRDACEKAISEKFQQRLKFLRTVLEVLPGRLEDDMLGNLDKLMLCEWLELLFDVQSQNLSTIDVTSDDLELIRGIVDVPGFALARQEYVDLEGTVRAACRKEFTGRVLNRIRQMCLTRQWDSHQLYAWCTEIQLADPTKIGEAMSTIQAALQEPLQRFDELTTNYSRLFELYQTLRDIGEAFPESKLPNLQVQFEAQLKSHLASISTKAAKDMDRQESCIDDISVIGLAEAIDAAKAMRRYKYKSGLSELIRTHFLSKLQADLKASISRGQQTGSPSKLEDAAVRITCILIKHYKISRMLGNDVYKEYEARVRDALKTITGGDLSIQIQAVLRSHCKHERFGSEAQGIIDTFSEFEDVSRSVFREKTGGVSFDTALAMVRCQPRQVNKDALKRAYKSFEQPYKNSLVKMEQESFDLDRAVFDIKQAAKSTKWSPEHIGRIVAGICTVWTGLDVEGRPGRLAKLQPHDVQLLTVFSLLGVGRVQGFVNQVAEVKTGEGKSITLGILACFLALAGFEVNVASFSPYLAGRDYAAFKKLFNRLHINNRVVYSTNTNLECYTSHKLPDRGNLVRRWLEGRPAWEPVASNNDSKKVLLLDEIDFFFGPAFYGRLNNTCVCLSDNKSRHFIRKMWTVRAKLRDPSFCSQIPSWPEFRALLEMYPRIGLLLPAFISDAKNAASHFPEGEETRLQFLVRNNHIVYEDPYEGTYSERHGGFETCFAYHYKHERGEIALPKDSRVFDAANYSLHVGIGGYLYSEFPKFFGTCLGVTATAETLNASELAILDRYKIRDFSYVPTIYQKQTMQRAATRVVQGSFDDFVLELKREIVNEVLKKHRACLVFVKDDEEIKKLRQLLTQKHKLKQEKGYQGIKPLSSMMHIESRERVIAESTRQYSITFANRSYGRGTDFVCRDTSVIQNGGVHIIQTYVAESRAEQVQIEGRTCRQDDPGSFASILHIESIERLGLKLDDFTTFCESNRYPRFSLGAGWPLPRVTLSRSSEMFNDRLYFTNNDYYLYYMPCEDSKTATGTWNIAKSLGSQQSYSIESAAQVPKETAISDSFWRSIDNEQLPEARLEYDAGWDQFLAEHEAKRAEATYAKIDHSLQTNLPLHQKTLDMCHAIQEQKHEIAGNVLQSLQKSL